jgi:hypothetical protein
MNKETIVTLAFRDHRSEFSCSLAAALPAERRVLARRGWAGENRGRFEHSVWPVPVATDARASEAFTRQNIFSAAC